MRIVRRGTPLRFDNSSRVKGSLGQLLEQTDLIGDIQVFGGHKSTGNLENGIGCDTRHEVPPGVGTFLLVASSGIPEECY